MAEPLSRRTCSRCKTPKLEADFYGPTAPYCRTCTRAYRNAANAKKRQQTALPAPQNDDRASVEGPAASPAEDASESRLAPRRSRKTLAWQLPEATTFLPLLKSSVELLTATVPTTPTCSCCRTDNEVENRHTYQICRRCKYSVDICGVCVIHPGGPAFRPELSQARRPTLNEIFYALGELPDTEEIESTAHRLTRKAEHAARTAAARTATKK